MVLQVITLTLLLGTPGAELPTCTIAAQQAWEQICYRTMTPAKEPLSATWSNADVSLDRDLLVYAMNCRDSLKSLPLIAATPADPLRAYYDRQSTLAVGCPLEKHIAWLEDCLSDVEALRIGQTRAQLLATFTTEGGISVPQVRRFHHRQCTLLHITVHFHLTSPEASEASSDTVTTIEGPYLAPTFAG